MKFCLSAERDALLIKVASVHKFASSTILYSKGDIGKIATAWIRIKLSAFVLNKLKYPGQDGNRWKLRYLKLHEISTR
jgi:hypothetical protein